MASSSLPTTHSHPDPPKASVLWPYQIRLHSLPTSCSSKILCFFSLCVVAQSCQILCNLMDYSPPGSSVHGILQTRILEWVAIPFSRRFSSPRGQTRISGLLHCRWILYCLSYQGSPLLLITCLIKVFSLFPAKPTQLSINPLCRCHFCESFLSFLFLALGLLDCSFSTEFTCQHRG